ncbi:MAG: hypothetical protein AAF518_08885 [Spirochaetota bacterium]
MRDKIAMIAFFILLVVSSSLLAKESFFNHPLRIEPASVYTKIRVDANARENREDNYYERHRGGTLEGEFSFYNFAIKGSAGKSRLERSGTSTLDMYDRFMVGLKYGREYGSTTGAFAWGLGLKGFSRIRNFQEYKKDTQEQNLYLIRPNLSLGLRLLQFELQAEAHVQTETNSSFRENTLQQFRRHYQGGVAISYGFGENFRLFAESEYREPYTKKVDTKTRFWNIYPGFSYQIYSGGRLAFSYQISMMKEKWNDDRGGRISYFHFF